MTSTNKMQCLVCSDTIDFHFTEDVNEELRTRQFCYTCNFWFEKVRLAHTIWKKTSVRIDGVHYHIAERSDSPFRGFGGQVFYIQFSDRPYEESWEVTNNLWCQGEIPEKWRKQMPDNATFVTAEAFEHFKRSQS